MVYKGTSYENGWFGGTPIFGHLHIFPIFNWEPVGSMNGVSPSDSVCFGINMTRMIYDQYCMDINITQYLIISCSGVSENPSLEGFEICFLNGTSMKITWMIKWVRHFGTPPSVWWIRNPMWINTFLEINVFWNPIWTLGIDLEWNSIMFFLWKRNQPCHLRLIYHIPCWSGSHFSKLEEQSETSVNVGASLRDIQRIKLNPPKRTHHPNRNWLVVWNMTFIFPFELGMSSSQLTFIFFRGVGQPPTRKGGDGLGMVGNFPHPTVPPRQVTRLFRSAWRSWARQTNGPSSAKVRGVWGLRWVAWGWNRATELWFRWCVWVSTWSIERFKGKITGTSHISWENLWSPVDFSLSQPIDMME